MSKGFYTSWETKLPNIPTPAVGNQIPLDTIFGRIVFKVVKVKDGRAELTSLSGETGANLRIKDGEWTFNHITFARNVTCKGQVV